MNHFLKYNRFCFHLNLLKTDMGENKNKKNSHLLRSRQWEFIKHEHAIHCEAKKERCV